MQLVYLLNVPFKQMRLSTNYRALQLPRLTAGISAKIATLLWMGVFAISIIFDSRWIAGGAFVIGIVLHRVLIWFFKKDPKVFEIYAFYTQTKDIYDSGSNQISTKNRPKGYGKDFPC